MQNDKVIQILKIALAFAFLYPAISGIINPSNWIGFLPSFIFDISFLAPAITLLVLEVVEIIVALWLLFSENPFYPAILASLLLLGIIIFNFNSFEIIFRDIALLLVSVALVVYGYNLKKNLLNNENEHVQHN